MSYCRFSSDDFRCDVYVYADVMGGWTTHVAARHVVYKDPLPERVSLDDTDAWMNRHKKVLKMHEEADIVPIDLPHAGGSFNDSTPGACADRLESLKALGYNVPQHAIDALREEHELAQ